MGMDSVSKEGKYWKTEADLRQPKQKHMNVFIYFDSPKMLPVPRPPVTPRVTSRHIVQSQLIDVPYHNTADGHLGIKSQRLSILNKKIFSLGESS